MKADPLTKNNLEPEKKEEEDDKSFVLIFRSRVSLRLRKVEVNHLYIDDNNVINDNDDNDDNDGDDADAVRMSTISDSKPGAILRFSDTTSADFGPKSSRLLAHS